MVDGAAADPTADVEGLDVQAKIALLAKLAFGATVSSESVRGFHVGEACVVASLCATVSSESVRGFHLGEAYVIASL